MKVFKIFLLISLFAQARICLSQKESIKIEVKTNKIASLLNFIDQLSRNRASANFEPVLAQKVFQDPLAISHLERFREVDIRGLSYDYEGFPKSRNTGTNIKDLLFLASTHSENLHDFKLHSFGFLHQSAHKSLFESLTYFEPLYDSLIWNPNEKKLQLQQKALESFIHKQGIKENFAHTASFYNSSWEEEMPFLIYLNPIAGKEGITQAYPMGNMIFADILTEQEDHASILGIVFHEMCHILFKAQSQKIQNDLEDYFLKHPSRFKYTAYHWIDEALATAIGNGWMYETLTGKLDDGDWYNNNYINQYAKKLYPILQKYLTNSQAIDSNFVAQAIRSFEQAFPNALIECDNLFSFFTLTTKEEPEPIFTSMFPFFEVRGYRTQTPLDRSAILEVNESSFTKIYIITRQNEDQYQLIREIVSDLPNVDTKENCIVSGVDEKGLAHILINVQDPSQLKSAFRALAYKKTISYSWEKHTF